MLLCLDYGSRYVGVAITDPDEKMALRHSVIDQKKQSLSEQLHGIVEKERVEKILVGVPISLSGKDSAQTLVSRNFISSLRQNFPTLAIESVDETLTSVEAEERVKFEGVSKDEAHAEAARLMLAEYLVSR